MVKVIKNCQARLEYILTLQRELPAQGTEEWLESRTHQFGGSEIASVLGKSPYMKPDEMIDKKITKQNIDAPACSFGRIFEPVAKMFMVEELEMNIKNTGSIKSGKYPVAYSPDGSSEKLST